MRHGSIGSKLAGLSAPIAARKGQRRRSKPTYVPFTRIIRKSDAALNQGINCHCKISRDNAL